MQVIKKFHNIFLQANLSIFIKPYDIIVINENSGFLGKIKYYDLK